MADGSTIAFFESPSLPARSPASHPGYDVFDHFAMQVDSKSDVDIWYQWLVDNDIDMVGPTDHGIIYSIYFHDADGRRLELTSNIDALWSQHAVQARADLDAWQATKKAATAAGTDAGGKTPLTRLAPAPTCPRSSPPRAAPTRPCTCSRAPGITTRVSRSCWRGPPS